MPSPTADLTPALVTALSAFATALVVAAIVGPLVQARTRRNDRWEKAVSDLSALVGVEFEQAIDEFRAAAYVEAAVRLDVQTRGLDPEAADVRTWVNGYENKRRDAEAALHHRQAELAKLVDLVRPRLGREDRAELAKLMRGVHIGMILLSGKTLGVAVAGTHLDALLDEIDPAADGAHAARKALARFIAPMALTMRPPRPIRRLVMQRMSGAFGWARWPYRRARSWALKRLAPPP